MKTCLAYIAVAVLTFVFLTLAAIPLAQAVRGTMHSVAVVLQGNTQP